MSEGNNNTKDEEFLRPDDEALALGNNDDDDDDPINLEDDDEGDDDMNHLYEQHLRDHKKKERNEKQQQQQQVSADGAAAVIDDFLNESDDDDDDDDQFDLENDQVRRLVAPHNAGVEQRDQSRNERVIDDIENQYTTQTRSMSPASASASTARASSVGHLSLADLCVDDILQENGDITSGHQNDNNINSNNHNGVFNNETNLSYENDEDEKTSRRKRLNSENLQSVGAGSSSSQNNNNQQQQPPLRKMRTSGLAAFGSDDAAESNNHSDNSNNNNGNHSSFDAKAQKTIAKIVFIKQIAEIFKETKQGEYFVRSSRTSINSFIDFHKAHKLPEPSFSVAEHLLTVSLISEGFICKLGDLVDQSNLIREVHCLASSSSSSSAADGQQQSASSSSSPFTFDPVLKRIDASNTLLQGSSSSSSATATHPGSAGWRKFLTINPWNVSQLYNAVEALPSIILSSSNQNNNNNNNTTAMMMKQLSQNLVSDISIITKTMQNHLAPNRTDPEAPLRLERVPFKDEDNTIPRKTFTHHQLMLFKSDIEWVCGATMVKAKTAILRECAQSAPERWNNNNSSNGNGNGHQQQASSSAIFNENDVVLNELHARGFINCYVSPNCEWICPAPASASAAQNNYTSEGIPLEFAKKFLSSSSSSSSPSVEQQQQQSGFYPVQRSLTQESFRAFLIDFRRIMYGASGNVQRLKLRADALDDLDILGWKSEKTTRFILAEFVKTNVISEIRKEKENRPNQYSYFLKYNSTLFDNSVSQEQARKEATSSFYAAVSNSTVKDGNNNNNQDRDIRNNGGNNASQHQQQQQNYSSSNNPNFVQIETRSGEPIFAPKKVFFFLRRVEKVFQTLGPTLGTRCQPAAAVTCGMFALFSNTERNINRRTIRRGFRSLLFYRLMMERSEMVVNPRDGKRVLSVTYELMTPFDPTVQTLEDIGGGENINNNNTNNKNNMMQPQYSSPLTTISSILYHQVLPEFLHNRMQRFAEQLKKNLSLNSKRKLLFFRRGEFIDSIYIGQVLNFDTFNRSSSRISILFYIWELQLKNYFEQNVTLSLPVKPFVIKSRSTSPGRGGASNTTMMSRQQMLLASQNFINPSYTPDISHHDLHQLNELLRSNNRDESMFGGYETIVAENNNNNRNNNNNKDTHHAVSLLQLTREEFEILDQSMDAGKVLLWLRRLCLRRQKNSFLQYKVVMMVKFDFSYMTTYRILDALDLLVERRFIIREFSTSANNNHGGRSGGQAILSIPQESIAGGKQLKSYSELVAALPLKAQYLLRDIRYIILEGVRNPSPLRSTLVRELKWKKWGEGEIDYCMDLLEERYFIQEVDLSSGDGGRGVVLRDPAMGGRSSGHFTGTTFMPPEIHINRHQQRNRNIDDDDDDYDNNNNTRRRGRGREEEDVIMRNNNNNTNTRSSAAINSNLLIPAPSSSNNNNQAITDNNTNNNNNNSQVFYYYNFYQQQHLPVAPDPETYRKYGSNYYRNPLHMPPPLKVLKGGQVVHRPGYDLNGPFIPMEQRMSPCKTPPPHLSHF